MCLGALFHILPQGKIFHQIQKQTVAFFSVPLLKKIPYTVGMRVFLLYELRLLFRIERELSDDDFLTEIDIL